MSLKAQEIFRIIIDLQYSDACKIQIIIAINFFPLKDAEEECAMHLRSYNIKLTSQNDAYDQLFVHDIKESDIIDKLINAFNMQQLLH